MDPPRRISNPNYMSSSNPAPPPSFQQSNPQIGPPDPFHRNRDSFRPPSHTESRENAPPHYWPASAPTPTSRGPEIQHRDILQPAPPPPQSPFSRQPTFGREHPRRLLLGGESKNEQPPPPLTTSSSQNYFPRHMPPPASSPHHSPPGSLNYPLSRGTLRTPPKYAAAEPFPPPSPGTRPNNMSISSIMGSESPAKSRMTTAWSPTSNSKTARSATGHAPRSPRSASTYGPKPDSQSHGDPSPVQYGPLNFPHGPQFSAIPTSVSATPKHSPPGAPGSYKDLSMPPRPYSQPGPETRDNIGYYHSGSFESSMQDRPGSKRSQGRRSDPKERDQGTAKENGARNKGPTDPATTSPSYVAHQGSMPWVVAGPAPSPRGSYRNYQGENVLQYGRWSPRHVVDITDADRPIASREGPPLPPEELDGIVYGPFLPQDPRSREPYATSHAQGRFIPRGDRHGLHVDSRESSQIDRSSKGPLLDAHLRKSLEDTQHRSILGAGYDSHRRVDRFSPLPQAVQGASSEPVGSGRASNIKTEFGRMFSGLGSGVGSTPVPMPPHSNGSPTPARGVHERYSRSPGAERLKRSFEVEGRFENEFVEGRATPGTSGARAGKRGKHAHATHHHHHHPPGQHHHHRHARADDDISGRHVSSTTPFNTLKFNTPLSNGPNNPGSNNLTRHHHHHTPHHHHHKNAGQTTPAPVQHIRRPITTIKTNPLLESVADLPRKHLGSQLYAPEITLPPASTPSFTKFPFATKPKPLPLFEGKENCTFTIRVPRDFLTDRSREHVCCQRQLWGTDVYTDDSDVLAAAIHAGWIRGAWGDDVDVSMLELNPTPVPNGVNGNTRGDQTTNKVPSPTDMLSEPPSGGPVSPPFDRDAHITVLVLSPLEKYAQKTWHGIRSRAWGDNHDGMSFKIHKIEWVNEGLESRWAERGAEALSKRLVEKRKSATRCAAMTPVKVVKSKVGGVVAV